MVKYFGKKSKKCLCVGAIRTRTSSADGFHTNLNIFRMSYPYEIKYLLQVVFRAWEEHQMGVSITEWRRSVMAKLYEIKHRTPNRTDEHLFCLYDVKKTFKQIDIFINNTFSK